MSCSRRDEWPTLLMPICSMLEEMLRHTHIHHLYYYDLQVLPTMCVRTEFMYNTSSSYGCIMLNYYHQTLRVHKEVSSPSKYYSPCLLALEASVLVPSGPRSVRHRLYVPLRLSTNFYCVSKSIRDWYCSLQQDHEEKYGEGAFGTNRRREGLRTYCDCTESAGGSVPPWITKRPPPGADGDSQEAVATDE